MAGSSLLALIDDIASILDDVSVMTKVAAKKTAGVLGDDLALNAQQVAGVMAERELPVVWAVAKGSTLNKVILVPAALAISAFAPGLVLPLLMLGGAYLCFEGFEKVLHRFLHPKEAAEHHAELADALADPSVDVVALEKGKIRGAVRTDFILSAEIVVIALGTVAGEPFSRQVGVLVAVAVLMTVGVYGLVAGIVKLDDAGLYLMRQAGRLRRGVGRGIVAAAPWLMKGLGIAGTAAMFLVGGGIVAHGIAPLEAAIHHAAEATGPLGLLVSTAANALVGIAVGALVLAAVSAVKRVVRPVRR
ncbi:DUF808 domain-containing protein [Myxococcota bacterium]|nr:DUF808 domain-containing protein [Myxococcota bacterium]